VHEPQSHLKEHFNAAFKWLLYWITVPIRRNLTGNAFANGNGTDRERVGERERNGYGMDTEWIQNGYQTEMEWIRNGYESQNGKKRSPECKL